MRRSVPSVSRYSATEQTTAQRVQWTCSQLDCHASKALVPGLLLKPSFTEMEGPIALFIIPTYFKDDQSKIADLDRPSFL
ncbi:unnamed protein product [Protopolystoma xenopodis]|uniref:Uncharacterized protein n=1 Tax=Protopolystoma xenopodis TaxID=117903 RepID=A0A448WTL1_9PLAT|nr:unnamed protein product [Protopolystoma xenopodis]